MPTEPRFAVLQLSGCAGCEVSLLNAESWLDQHALVYMPLVISSDDVPPVDRLLVSGAVRTDEDLHRLRRAVRQAREVIAVGTCAISGGVANLGNRAEVREIFMEQEERRHLPRLLPHASPIDAFVPVTCYLPGCPPTPELFMAALFDREGFQGSKTVCQECGRKRVPGMRPAHLLGFQTGQVDPDICLVNQGYLCVGSSTRGGFRAPCTRAGHPCVGCRGPSNVFISRSSQEWLSAIARVFRGMTDVPADELDAALRSPQLALFVFQFADYAAVPRDPAKVL
ncbi:MAG: hypothetical protein GX557_02860 [Chloroflexi bacterium]|nr:hypothetical protein [Chloroflexota bacterium]